VKYSVLSGFIAILGIVCVAIYFNFFLWAGAFFGLMLPCYIFIGIIEMNISKRKLMVNHSKLFGSIAVLGAVFVTTFSTILYLSYTTDLGGISSLVEFCDGGFLVFLLIGGTVFLTIGILEIGIQHFKNHKSLFTIPIVILIPIFVFALISLVMSSIPLTVGF
jgi:hypothetical protein